MATRYSSALISLGTPMIMPWSFLGSRFILGRMAKRIKVNSRARPLAFPRKMRSSITIAKESGGTRSRFSHWHKEITMKRFALVSVFMAVIGVVTYFQVINTSAKDQDKATKNPSVIMYTSMGRIEVELYPGKAPITVKNFSVTLMTSITTGPFFIASW